MVMQIQPFANCIEKLKSERTYDAIVFMTPDGEVFNQGIANSFSTKKNLMILCGHYKGIDQRIRDVFVTHEISIGDYVLDRKSTRLNSSHVSISYAVFCLKKKKRRY